MTEDYLINIFKKDLEKIFLRNGFCSPFKEPDAWMRSDGAVFERDEETDKKGWDPLYLSGD